MSHDCLCHPKEEKHMLCVHRLNATYTFLPFDSRSVCMPKTEIIYSDPCFVALLESASPPGQLHACVVDCRLRQPQGVTARVELRTGAIFPSSPLLEYISAPVPLRVGQGSADTGGWWDRESLTDPPPT